MLTHYTKSAEAVANILRYGFAWFPNVRRLTNLLIPDRDFSKREPQEFGMVSFTEIEPPCAAAHRRQFGPFGIVVSKKWANEKEAQRVIYVDDRGPLTETFCSLFAEGYADLTRRINHPDDDAWLMAYENKNIAGALSGSVFWSNLLQLWEYLEPASSAAQREWRIVNPVPHYSLSKDKTKAIAQVSPPQGWANAMNVLPIPQSEVVALVCVGNARTNLRANLPPNFRDIEIIEQDL